MNGSRRENLNNLVLLSVLFFALKLQQILPELQSSLWYIPVSMLSATGVYVFLMRVMFWVVSKSELLLRIYWGKLYLKGYWSYEYSRDNKRYFGIWRFEQDLDNVRVVGSGLNDRFLPRTIVRSVSPLIEEQGAFFVLNVRTELEATNGLITPVYSKTTLILDAPRGFNQVVTMRATTEIYGGISSGQLHPDVIFKKHLNAKTDEDVIEDLKTRQQEIDQSNARKTLQGTDHKLLQVPTHLTNKQIQQKAKISTKR